MVDGEVREQQHCTYESFELDAKADGWLAGFVPVLVGFFQQRRRRCVGVRQGNKQQLLVVD